MSRSTAADESERITARAVLTLEAIMARDVIAPPTTPTPVSEGPHLMPKCRRIACAPPPPRRAQVELEEDVEIDEKGKRYYHGLEPGSCVRCLKGIGDLPVCHREVPFKDCRRCNTNRSQCNEVPARFKDKARELEEVFSEGPGSFPRLERLRTAFVKEVNAFYLYERNKIDGNVPAASRKRKERASASASSPRVPPIGAQDYGQLDRDLDHNCTPFGTCGSYGAPFKITCAAYGYTLVGKGTTAGLWKVVSREAEIYRVLQKAQGSAVPVFLGRIDLKLFFFLHGAEDIRHMLLMSWAGESIENVEDKEVLRHEISRSKKEIRILGVLHKDLRSANMLWNDELRRVLIIDFHRSELDRRPMKRRVGSLKRPLHQVGMSKRPCNNSGLTGRISTTRGSDVQSSV
ncbi:hypothetical protein ACJ73_07194 [Blastomyces percursus]|uniref:Protein kinase domain-containing protein n=1 Tax=Blastomyces percursus TaxID=1658174 RepID=A0A1J9PYS0_9EURO|nr:hypothetical protein ACJ73_07194 [Blastomyces percursus]